MQRLYIYIDNIGEAIYMREEKDGNIYILLFSVILKYSKLKTWFRIEL